MKEKYIRNINYIVSIILGCLIFGIIYYITCLCPMYPDEIVNSFVIEGDYGQVYTSSNQISGLKDIVFNSYKLYKTWTGRYTSTFLASLFRYFPDWIFHICNAAVFLLLIFTFLKIAVDINEKNERTKFLWPFALIVVFGFLIIPNFFDQTYIWETGSIVYAHMLLLSFAYIYIYIYRLNKKTSKILLIKSLSMLLLGGMVGGTLEHLAPSVFFFCFVLTLGSFCLEYRKKNNTFKSLLQNYSIEIVGLIGLFFGTCVLILCPGNACRNGEAAASKLLDKIDIKLFLNYIQQATKSIVGIGNIVLIILVLTSILFMIAVIVRVDKKAIIVAFLSVLSAVLSIVLLYFSPLVPGRVYIVPYAFLVMAFCILLFGVYNRFIIWKWQGTVCVLLIACIFSIFYIGRYTKLYINEYDCYSKIKKEQVQILNKAKKRGDNIVTLKTVNPSEHYIFTLDMQGDSESWVNRCYARYYGVDVVMQGEENSAFMFENSNSVKLLDKPFVFAKNIVLKQVYLMKQSDDLAIVKLEFNGDLDTKRLYKKGKKFNQISINYSLKQEGTGGEYYRVFHPYYKKEEDCMVTYTTISLPKGSDDTTLAVYMWNPKTENAFHNILYIPIK